MKTRQILIMILAILAIVTRSQVATAQTARTDTSVGTFKVIQGTTLWNLSGQINGDQRRWSEIFDANVAAEILDSSRLRYDSTGRPIVILEVGSTIFLNRQAAARAPNTVAEVLPVSGKEADNPPVVTATTSPNYWWILWALLAMAILATIFMIRRSLANPVTSGPPIREGGINDEAAPGHFQATASRTTGASGTAGYVSPEHIRVVNIRRGRGFGLMRVRYRGREKEEIKRLNGEVVYQATVEFPGGRQEMMYCLQGCANDLVYVGTRYFADRLFRFEAENASIYVPPQETVARAGNTDVRIVDDELVINQAGQTITFGAESWSLRQGANGGLVISSEGRSNIEFRNGRIYGAELPKSTVPAKSGEAEEVVVS